MTHRTWLLLLAIVMLAVPRSTHAVKEAPPLTISVAPNAATYAVGDPVTLMVTLTNVSSAPVTVSATAVGNISIAKALRDSESLKPVATKVNFFDGVSALPDQVEALRALQPSETASFPLEAIAGDDRASFFVVITPGSKSNRARVYALETGRYSMTLRYQYRGPTRDFPNVYDKPLKAAEVTFDVH